MSLQENIKAITSPTKSTWLPEAAKRVITKTARTYSRKMALRILQVSRQKQITQVVLAQRLGVSLQQVGKMVRGEEDFNFEMIAKLEKALIARLLVIDSGNVEDMGEKLIFAPVVNRRSLR